MTKSCPNCGGDNTPESRFCRRCGVSLKSPTGDAPATLVSPLANTIPLIDEGRSTDGFAPDDPLRLAPDTTKVNRTELDAILRAARPSQAEDDEAGNDSLGHKTIFDPSLQFISPRVDETADTRIPFPPSSMGSPSSTPSYDGDVADELTGAAVTGELRAPTALSNAAVPDNLQAAGDVRTATTDTAATSPVPPATSAPPRGGRPGWLLPLLGGVAALLILGVAGVGGWLAFRYMSRPVMSDPVNVSNVTPDAKQLFAEKLTEAESLLAAGDIDGGIARLREASQINPSDVGTHRRLADLLLQNGRPREAAEEYRAVTQLDANDAPAWRALASVQFGENLPAEAIESYRRYFELSGDAGQQDATALLAYADALRSSGATDEARAVYEKVSASTTMVEEARIARQRLAELAAQPAATPAPPRDTRAELSRNDQPAPAPTLAPPPPRHPRRLLLPPRHPRRRPSESN